MLPSLGSMGDNPEKFFRRSLFDVSPGDLWRWLACCAAIRDVSSPPKKDVTDGQG